MSNPWRWNCADWSSAATEDGVFPPQPARTAVAGNVAMRMTPDLNPCRPYGVHGRFSTGPMRSIAVRGIPLYPPGFLPMKTW
jgi:hypothetical protein